MFLEAERLEKKTQLQTDVCIVGAGAAGITLLRALAATPLKLLLVESGGTSPEPATQSLYEGEVTGKILGGEHRYLTESRARYFGGTTSRWGGWCLPLGAADFEKREWIPDSGWPLTAKEMAPYYTRACDTLKIPPEFQVKSERLQPDSAGIVSDIYRQQPFQFGEIYQNDLRASQKFSVLLNSNVIRVGLNEAGDAVKELDLRTLGGKSATVRAKVYVLAVGGLENARLLLSSNDVHKNGVGNDKDRVGRYFMEHLHLTVGRVGLVKPLEEWEPYMHFVKLGASGDRLLASLRLSDAVQKEERCLTGSFTLMPLFSAFAQDKKGHGEFLTARFRHLFPRPDFSGLTQKYAAGLEKHRRDTALFQSVSAVASLRASAVLHGRLEQSPNPDSRVSLAKEKDALGMRKLRLEWKTNELDRQSLTKTTARFALELGRTGWGRVQRLAQDFDPWPVTGGGCHHMGTTRMSDSPDRGVVDREGKVHGVKNLYVAGSSVFPTSGFANPTLTILALTLRLADRLKAAT